MKKTAFILLLATTSASFAQELKEDNFRLVAAQETERLNSMLTLTELQASKVTIIEEKYFGDLCRLSKNIPLEGRSERIAALNDEKNNALRTVLSPEQYVLYRERVEQQKAKAEAHITQFQQRQRRKQN